MKKIVFPLIIILIALAGCASTTTLEPRATDVTGQVQTPQWYLSGQVPGYGTQEYLIGTGQGPTLEDAIAEAQSVIGGQLKVSVDSTVESFRKESNIDGQMNFFETFSESSTITVNETIKGSQIAKQEQVAGTYYVFAALHIQRYIAQLLIELGDIQRQVTSQLSQARSAVQRALVFEAMDRYSSAYDLLVDYYTKRAYVEALAPNQVPRGITSASEVVSEIRAMLSAITLSVVSGDAQEATLGSDLPEPVVFQVAYRAAGGQQIPVASIPVTLRGADRSSLGRYTTDSNGRVSVSVQAVPSARTGGSVSATMDMYAIMGPFAGYVGRPEAQVTYTITKPVQQHTVSLQLIDAAGKRMPSLERSVARELEGLGVAVQAQSDWSIVGICYVVSEQHMSSFQGTQYLASVELELELFDPQSSRRSSVVFPSSGMSLQHADDAIVNACASVRVDAKRLASLLSAIE